MIPNILLFIMPIVILAGGGMILMLADAFQDDDEGLAIPTAFLHFAAAASALALWNRAGDPQVLQTAATTLGGYLVFDRQALFLDVVIAIGGLLASLMAGGYLAEHGMERGEFYTLLTFASAGCMMFSASNDLMMLFIGLETLSLGVYAMTAFRRTSPRSQEGALKYFLLGSFAAALFLYGGALLYGVTGHTDLPGIRDGLLGPYRPTLPEGFTGAAADNFVQVQQTVRDRIGAVAMVLIVVSLCFKISAVPFHMWTPDAYEGAPTPATAYMSVAVKAAAFGGMLRVLLTLFGDPTGAGSVAGGWAGLLAWIAVFTMTFANIVALAQTSVKRMLAYSSIAHAGYLLVGVVVAPRNDLAGGGPLTVGQGAVAAVLFYLLAYSVSNAGAFGALMLAGRKNREAVTYDDLAGLGKRHPGVAFAMTFFLLSLTGVPPTVGFFAKFYVIRSAIEAGYSWLAVLALLNSALAAYYYLRVMVKMYMHDPAPGAPEAEPMDSDFLRGTLVLAAVMVLVLGITPQRYLSFALEAVRQVATTAAAS